jgi:hypothetical protein
MVLVNLAAAISAKSLPCASNAHAYRLYVFKDPSQEADQNRARRRAFFSFLAAFAAISEALNYDTFLKDRSTFFFLPTQLAAPFGLARCFQQSLRSYHDFCKPRQAHRLFLLPSAATVA